MEDQIKEIEISDLASAQSILRSKNFRTTDLAGGLHQLTALTNKDFSALAHRNLTNPFFMNGLEHLRFRRIVANFYSENGASKWRGVFEEIARRNVNALLQTQEPELRRDFIDPFVFQCAERSLGAEPVDLRQWCTWTDALWALLEDLPSLRAFGRTQIAFEAVMEHLAKEPQRIAKDPTTLRAVLLTAADGGNWSREEATTLLAVNVFATTATSMTLANFLAVGLSASKSIARTIGPTPPGSAQCEALISRHSGPQRIDRRCTAHFAHRDCAFELGDVARIRIPEVNKSCMGERVSAGEHISFGAGTHLCPGRHFAVLMTEIALKTLHDAAPDMKLSTEGEVEYRRTSQINAAIRIPCASPRTSQHD